MPRCASTTQIGISKYHTTDDVEALAAGRVPLVRSAELRPWQRRPTNLQNTEGAPAPASVPAKSLQFSAAEQRDVVSEISSAVAPLYGVRDPSEGRAGRAARGQGGASGVPDALEALIYLMDPARPANPKLEVRRAVGPGGSQGRCAQVALCAESNARRSEVRELLERRPALDRFFMAPGGDVTLELTKGHVNKARVCEYARDNFDVLIDAMGYIPGPKIDARGQRLLIVSDCDGTLYEPQESCPDDPLGANLSNSPAREAVLDYLRAGGILGLCTGNDLWRTKDRFLAGIPAEERSLLLSRIFVAADGGACLAVFDGSGRLRDHERYSVQAAQAVAEEAATSAAAAAAQQTPQGGGAHPRSRKGGDVATQLIYMGDDCRPEGNDMPGFHAVGMARSICVADTEDEEKIPAELRANHLPGGAVGSAAFLRALLRGADSPHGGQAG